MRVRVGTRTLRPARPLLGTRSKAGVFGTLGVDASTAEPDSGAGIGALALETVELLERAIGYERGFAAIKAQIPTYESVLRPPSHAATVPEHPKGTFIVIERGP